MEDFVILKSEINHNMKKLLLIMIMIICSMQIISCVKQEEYNKEKIDPNNIEFIDENGNSLEFK